MPLFYLALGWLVGLWLAHQSGVAWWAWLIVSGVAAGAIALARERPNLRLAFGCLLMLGFGAARLDLAAPTFDDGSLAAFNEREIARLEGVVDDAPVTRNATITLRVRANKVILAGGVVKPVNGLMIVTTISGEEFRYGDLISVTGNLQTPPTGAQFSYRDYLARAGIFSQMSYALVRVIDHDQGNPIQAALLAWRDAAASRIKQLMPDPEASLMQGILLGNDDGISPEVKAAFNAVSATHIIAISGANMVVIAGFLQALAGRFAKEPWITVITLAGVIIYTIFVGANPAVVRAAIMTSLVLIAARLGRQTYGPASLGFAALAMTALNPYSLWDVGFQLSFLATAGLIFYVEPLKGWIAAKLPQAFSTKGAISGIVSDAIFVTIAAQFMTAPIIALYFDRLPVLSLPVNFLIIPAQPPIMILGGLGTLASFVVWPVGQALAWISWLFLAYTVFVVKLFAALPLASVEAALSPVLVAAFYGGVLIVTAIQQQPQEERQGVWQALRKNISLKAVAATGAVIATLFLIAGFSLPDGKLHITALDVGEGSAMLIQTPSGRHILIDAGGDGRTLSAAVGQRMPFWKRQIDMAIITQPTQASSAGLGTLLERYEIPLLIVSSAEVGPLFESVQEKLAGQGTKQEIGYPGMVAQLGDGVSIMALNSPSGSSVEPISLLVSYGQTRILVPGDISAEGQQALFRANSGAGSHILYVSAADNTLITRENFLNLMAPQVVIVSDSSNSPLDSGVLALIEQGGRNVFTLSNHGSVELISDGARLWVLTER